jgi:hypothetical protein
MNATKARKKGNTRVSFPEILTVSSTSQRKFPSFPDNLLVVGSGDENGTYLLVVVLAGPSLAA